MAYMQHEIDEIFYNVQAWVSAYVNDIVYRIRLLANLLDKLQALFEIFFTYNISIKPTKLYLNYLNMALLGQQVNFFGLTTLEQKVKAI